MRTVAFVLLSFAASAAVAQRHDSGVRSESASDQAVAAMQATAIRPDDETLTCGQLQTELTAITTDPQLQATAQQQQAFAEQQQAQLAKADEQQQVDGEKGGRGFGQVARGFGRGLLSKNPATARVEQAARAAENAEMTAQAQRNIELMTNQMQQLQSTMPQAMRASRVVELAQARDCAWLTEMPAQPADGPVRLRTE